MNYIDEVKAFESWTEINYLPPMSQLLWYKLMSLCNRHFWSEWIKVGNQQLMASLHIKREESFIAVRNKLIEAGLIEYKKGKKGFPSQYKINTFNLKAQSGVQSGVKNGVQSGAETVDIYIQNTKDIKKNNKEKNFIPPNVEEIKKYISEKDLKVDAEKFYNYFSEGNWIDSKGNKVKNWKQKLLTWDKYSSPKKNDENLQKYYDKTNQFDNLSKFYANL